VSLVGIRFVYYEKPPRSEVYFKWRRFECSDMFSFNRCGIEELVTGET